MEENSQLENIEEQSLTEMEEVSISQIDNTANRLEDDDLVFISQYNQNDGSFTSAKIRGKNLLTNEKKPGMIVRMWEVTEEDSSYYNYLNTVNCCDSAILEGIDLESDTIDSVLTLSNGTDTKVCNAVSIQSIDVTSGCGALYDTDNGGYFDWYNGSKWKYYTPSGSNCLRIIAYLTRVYLTSDQIIAFKGSPANTLNIVIDGDHPIDQVGNPLQYITCDSETYDNAKYASSSTIFRYRATRSGYHIIKIIATNRGGDNNKFSIDDNLVVSFDNGTTWNQMSNDSWSVPVFFIPDTEFYNDLWYAAERIREQDDHYIDFEDNGSVTYEFDSSRHLITLTANDSGTLMIALGGQIYGNNDKIPVIIEAKMPESYLPNSKWVEVTKYVAHHGGGWQNTYKNISISLPLRVIKGTSFRIQPLASIDYQNCTLFKDTAYERVTVTSADTQTDVQSYTVTFMSNNSIYQQQNVRAGKQISEIKPLINPTRSADSSFSYTFSHWDVSDNTVVNSSLIVNAVYNYTVNKYTVEFVNNNGDVLQTGEVSKWSIPSYTGNQPTYANPKDGVTYTFKGWNPPIGSISGDTVYVAQYDIENQEVIPDPEVQYYKVRFIVNNVVVSEQLVKEDSSTKIKDIKPENPQDVNTEDGLNKFDCWNYSDDHVINGDTDVNALFVTIKNYRVTWVDSVTNETIVINTNVPVNTKIGELKPNYNKNHQNERYNYTFIGWNLSDEYQITSNITVYTNHRESDRLYTVKFMNDTHEVKSSQLKYGESIVYSDIATPVYTKELEEGSGAEFVGWNPQPASVVTGDATYYAVFNVIISQVKIRFFDHRGISATDDNAIKIVNVNKGTKVADIFSEAPNDVDNEIIRDGLWQICGWVGDNYRYSYSCEFENEDVVTKNIDFYGWYECDFTYDKTISDKYQSTAQWKTVTPANQPYLVNGLFLCVSTMSFDWTVSGDHSNHYQTVCVGSTNPNNSSIVQYKYLTKPRSGDENVTFVDETGSINDGNGITLQSNTKLQFSECIVQNCSYTWTLSNLTARLFMY